MVVRRCRVSESVASTSAVCAVDCICGKTIELQYSLNVIKTSFIWCGVNVVAKPHIRLNQILSFTVQLHLKTLDGQLDSFALNSSSPQEKKKIKVAKPQATSTRHIIVIHIRIIISSLIRCSFALARLFNRQMQFLLSKYFHFSPIESFFFLPADFFFLHRCAPLCTCASTNSFLTGKRK